MAEEPSKNETPVADEPQEATYVRPPTITSGEPETVTCPHCKVSQGFLAVFCAEWKRNGNLIVELGGDDGAEEGRGVHVVGSDDNGPVHMRCLRLAALLHRHVQGLQPLLPLLPSHHRQRQETLISYSTPIFHFSLSFISALKNSYYTSLKSFTTVANFLYCIRVRKFLSLH